MKKTDLEEVRQHNIITSARYEMSAIEMDIVFCLLLKIKAGEEKIYQISVNEIEELTGRKWNYQQFKNATIKLGSRVYEVETGERHTQIWLLGSADYIKGTGIIELELSEKIKPFLLDLKEHFTSYKLQSAISLTSKYAKRIYQLASQWKNIGHVKYSIDEIKEILYLKDPKGIEPEQYKQIGQFKEKVLDIATEQINSQTDLNIRYKLHKHRRSFKYITFYISSQKVKIKPLDFKEDGKSLRAVKIAEEIGITRKNLLREIAKDESIQKMLRKYANDIKLGNYEDVRNKAAYFIKMMENHKKDQNGTD